MMCNESFPLPRPAGNPTIRSSMECGCLSEHASGVVLRVKVTPNARRTGVVGIMQEPEEGERLQVRLNAPPVGGKANAALRKWVAQSFGVRVSAVSFVRGEQSRRKDLLLEGMAPEQAQK